MSNVKMIVIPKELVVPKVVRAAYASFLPLLSDAFFTACFDYNFETLQSSTAECPVTYGFGYV